jgi:hypothetical protein
LKRLALSARHLGLLHACYLVRALEVLTSELISIRGGITEQEGAINWYPTTLETNSVLVGPISFHFKAGVQAHENLLKIL